MVTGLCSADHRSIKTLFYCSVHWYNYMQQEAVLTRYDSTHDELVLYSYMGAVAIMAAINLYTGELAKVTYCTSNSYFVWSRQCS
jgi:hypothetical protein